MRQFLLQLRLEWRMLALMFSLLSLLLIKGAAIAPPSVREATASSGFDTGRAIARLERVLGDERPHPVDTEANDAVRERLISEIRALGYEPQVRDDFTCRAKGAWIACGRVRNILFAAGSQDVLRPGYRGPKAIMVASHYDSVPAGPGAADDGLGVAVSLELAGLIRQSPLDRPVVFLITDGEEMGLLGAKAFADADPVRLAIDRVINLEARGVRGPALMFETSHPNEGDIRAFAHGVERPVSNSMMTDIYRLLPNDTDVSEFLPLGFGALNFSITGGLAAYHTPLDNLASLDRRSVQHMGDQALSSLRGSLSGPASESSAGNVIFTDVLSRGLLIIPAVWGVAVFLLGVIAAGWALIRGWTPTRVRALVFPPLLILVSGLLAYGLQAGVAAIRVEDAYWYAHPQAILAAGYMCGMLCGAVLVWRLGVLERGKPLIISTTVWLSLIGLAAVVWLPGAAILLVPPVVLLTLAMIAGAWSERLQRWLAAVAAVAGLIALLPALEIVETGLGPTLLTIPAVVAAICFLLLAPFSLGSEQRSAMTSSAVTATGLVVATALALLLPAYSATNPRPMNIRHYTDATTGVALWLLDPTDEPAPAELRRIAKFAPARLPVLGQVQAARAAAIDIQPPELIVLADAEEQGRRRLRLRFDSQGADQLIIRFPASADARWFTVGDEQEGFDDPGVKIFHCAGRACDGLEFTVDTTVGSAEWRIIGLHHGLPEAAAPLTAARPSWTTPIQYGDATLVAATFKP